MLLIALYKQPPDPAAFDKAYFESHLPLIRKVPGLLSTRITRITRAVQGDSFHLMAEMAFADEAALKAAMRSPEMATAGANLNTFAAGLVTLMYGREE